MSVRSARRGVVQYAGLLEHGVHAAVGAGVRSGCIRELGEIHDTPSRVAVYALFVARDGPSTAADICARNFAPSLLEHETFPYDTSNALRGAIDALEAFVCAKSRVDHAYFGATALAAAVRDGKLYVANVGDSRALLVSRDGPVRLTREHTVHDAQEAARVKKAGGFFAENCVNGMVPYTRALGELHFKERKHVYFSGREMTAGDILSAQPDVCERVLVPGDDFLVLASPLVWAHVSDASIASIVRAAAAKHEQPRTCARRVASAALSAGAVGRLSVLVVFLKDAAKAPLPSPGGTAHLPRRRALSAVSAAARAAALASVSAPASPPPFPRAPQGRDLSSPPASPSPPTSPTLRTPPTSTNATSRSPIRTTRPDSLYTERGAGARARRLVPVAAWGVAPGGAPMERLLPAKSPDTEAKRLSLTTVAGTARPAQVPRAHTDLGTARRVRPKDRDSHDKLPEPTPTPAPPPPAPRFSHITHSTERTTGSSDAGNSLKDLVDETDNSFDLSRSGPSKVRYRDHDLFARSFGFLRRKKAPSRY